MTIVMEKYAGATPVVGYNLAAGMDWAKHNVPVRITQIGLIGSTAIGDTEIDVYYGTTKIANFHNSKSADLVMTKPHKFWMSSQRVCYPNSRINIEVVKENCGANALLLFLNIQEVRR